MCSSAHAKTMSIPAHLPSISRATTVHILRRGGAEKDPASWHMGAVKAQRHMVADVINLHLEMAEVAAWVDPRTLEDRDIPREAEPKLLPSESRAYREEGIISERMQQVLTIRAERAVHMQREQDHARDYWQERKAQLGISRDMPMEQQLAHIRQARDKPCHDLLYISGAFRRLYPVG